MVTNLKKNPTRYFSKNGKNTIGPKTRTNMELTDLKKIQLDMFLTKCETIQTQGLGKLNININLR